MLEKFLLLLVERVTRVKPESVNIFCEGGVPLHARYNRESAKTRNIIVAILYFVKLSYTIFKTHLFHLTLF